MLNSQESDNARPSILTPGAVKSGYRTEYSEVSSLMQQQFTCWQPEIQLSGAGSHSSYIMNWNEMKVS